MCINIYVYIYILSASGLLLPEARVLLQAGLYNFLILQAVDGAGGVDQVLQAGEPEGMVQTPQLKGGQGSQASQILLLVIRATVPEAHHTWSDRLYKLYLSPNLIVYRCIHLLFSGS